MRTIPLDGGRAAAHNRAMSPARHAALSVTVAGVLVALAVVLLGYRSDRHARQDRQADRQTIEAQQAEIDRLKGVVEAQKDSIRRLEEIIAWQAKNPRKE